MDPQARIDMEMTVFRVTAHLDGIRATIFDGNLSLAWDQLVAARKQLEVLERRMQEVGIPAQTTPG